MYKIYKENKSGYLKVSDLHEIYWEESGSPDGIPIVNLHGGPGSKSKPKYRQFINPEKWRLIMFDQRGCGKSKPSGEIKDNTTWDLVEDMEKLRKQLNIDRWVIFGGSWGSTLGLAYTEKHPDKVLGMILRSIFLFRKKDVEWLVRGKALRRMFPDIWTERIKYLDMLNIDPEKPENELLKVMLEGSDKDKILATLAAENWESNLVKIDKEFKPLNKQDIGQDEINSQKLLLHYVKNNGFLNENQIIKNASRLSGIPTVIIHGRYDVVCPLDQAWELHKSIPDSELVIVPGAGHHSTEPGITEKLIEYTGSFSQKLQ